MKNKCNKLFFFKKHRLYSIFNPMIYDPISSVDEVIGVVMKQWFIYYQTLLLFLCINISLRLSSYGDEKLLQLHSH